MKIKVKTQAGETYKVTLPKQIKTKDQACRWVDANLNGVEYIEVLVL